MNLRKTWRQFGRALGETPIHPQWLIRRRRRSHLESARRYVRGCFVDVGCADGECKRLFADEYERYLGIDYPATANGLYGTRPHVYADAARLPLGPESADSVSLLSVLEHVREPRDTVKEICRVLKPGGHLLLTVPFLYPIHDGPHDYYRFSINGIRHLLEGNGFHILELFASGGFVNFMGQSWNLFMMHGVQAAASKNVIFGAFLVLPAMTLATVVNLIVFCTAWMGRSERFELGYYLVAKKR